MRWIAPLVALCLLAGGVARPPRAATSGHAAPAMAKPTATSELASRRQTLSPERAKREHRPLVFVVGTSPHASAPVRHLVTSSRVVLPAAPASPTVLASSRGPPASRVSVHDHHS